MVSLFEERSGAGGGRGDLRRVIRGVRRRWRLKVALRGAALVIAAGLVTLAVSAWGLDHFRYSAGAITAFRVLAWTALLALAFRFLALPLAVRLPDERVALYIEEHDPSLQAALLSAIELEGRGGEPRADQSPALVERVVETALERCREIDYGRLVEGRALQRVSGMLAAVASLGMLAVLLSPAFLRQAMPFLLVPWDFGRSESPYAIEVQPGNGVVARGADQIVSARLVGFDSSEVELAVQMGEDGEWRRLPMTVEPGQAAFSSVLLDLSDRTEYFVEAAGVRSDLYRLNVEEVPYVGRIDLEYRFPDYTGLDPRSVENGGDVAALRGTEVLLTVTPTVPVPGGRLVVEDEEPVELQPLADGRLAARLVVERDGFYRIELPGTGGVLAAASPDYVIEVLFDQPPSVAFRKPGRDTQATPVEEIFTEVEAEDDFGVARLELVYSVNGAPEQTLTLSRSRSPRKQVSAGHTFFLEELELEPGDFVSYYARALDNRGAPGSQQSATDIYFLQVRPFERVFRQAEQGGAGAAGGGQGGGALSEQQRQIVAATFRLSRDREAVPQKQFSEDVATVALLQGRLQEQVDRLRGRMANRGVLGADSEFATIASALETASAEMGAARERLDSLAVGEALPPEQRALQQLQRAEADFGDVQVSFGNEGSGGQGGEMSAEELADLFELELDKLQNQYETVQRGEQQRSDAEVDEAMQRLKELARRQQQENERLRRRGGAPNQSGGGGGSQRELAEQAEELGRRLERLARQNSDPSLEDTARRLKEAADAMRRAGASGEEGGLSEGISALDRLQDARRLLDKQRAGRIERDVRDAAQRAEQLRRDQGRIAQDVAEAGRAGRLGGEQMQRLDERKDALAEEVARLEQQLDAMARDSRRSAKQTSRKLDEAAEGIRDSKLKEKIRYSRGVVRSRLGEEADRFEGVIGEDIEALSERIAGAARALGEEGADPKTAALEQARDLVRRLESINERVQEGSPGGEPASRGEQRASGEGESQGESGGSSGAAQPGGADGLGGSTGPGGPGAFGYGLRPGVFGESEARQLRREFRERGEEARALARQLEGTGGVPADLQAVMRKLNQLESAQAWGDPRGLAELAAEALEDLKLFEYALRRELEGKDPEKLRLSGSEEVPDGWRALVEEYYRTLAREGG